MFSILVRSVKTYDWLRTLVLALICSSVGSGLTFIMVFAELARLHAGPSSFAIAFILSTSPGLLGSIIGKALLQQGETKYCLIAAECIGALGLLIPWYGLRHDSVAFLQLAGIASSIAAGMTLPAINHYTKAKLAPEDIGAGALIDTLVFACQVLFGIGIGAFIYGKVSSDTYLLVNLINYLLAILFIASLPRLVSFTHERGRAHCLPRQLSAKQRASLYLLPALAMTGAPAMSLLPTLIKTDNSEQETLLLLLFARSLGQLLGPFLVKEDRYKNPSALFIIGCLAAFILCYIFVPFSPLVTISLLLVFLAHIFSNIIYSIGWYSLLTHFEKHQVAAASASSYRKQIIIGAAVSIVAGWLAERIGSHSSLICCSGVGLLLSSTLILYVKRRQ